MAGLRPGSSVQPDACDKQRGAGRSGWRRSDFKLQSGRCHVEAHVQSPESLDHGPGLGPEMGFVRAYHAHAHAPPLWRQTGSGDTEIGFKRGADWNYKPSKYQVSAYLHLTHYEPTQSDQDVAASARRA